MPFNWGDTISVAAGDVVNVRTPDGVYRIDVECTGIVVIPPPENKWLSIWGKHYFPDNKFDLSRNTDGTWALILATGEQVGPFSTIEAAKAAAAVMEG